MSMTEEFLEEVRQASRELHRTKRFVVAVYDCDKRYGGPEEGGWWYQVGSLVRVIRVERNLETACAFARRMNDKLRGRVIGPNVGKRYGIDSVCSEGEYWAEVHDEYAPKGYPETRPRYE